MAKGSALKGALAAMPKGGKVTSMPVGKPNPATQAVTGAMQSAQGAGLQRMSPGVYRNQQGGLVNSHGGAIPGQQPQHPPMNVPQPHKMPMGPGNQMSGIATGAAGAAAAGMGAGMGAAFGNKPYMFPQLQPPSGQYGYGSPEQMYTGGSPNFNESTQQAAFDHTLPINMYSQSPEQYAALLAQKQAYAQQMGQRQPYNQQQQAQQPQQGIVASSPGTPNNGNIY
jgi:hypothetical protein